MRSWRWPQWAMIAFLGYAFFQSSWMGISHGKFRLETMAFVWGWFGLQWFICWAGGFWSRRQ